VELLWMLDWVEDHLLQLLLCLFEATDILPLNVWYLYDCFTQRGWVALSTGGFEVVL
jgi:hypothetical protein